MTLRGALPVLLALAAAASAASPSARVHAAPALSPAASAPQPRAQPPRDSTPAPAVQDTSRAARPDTAGRDTQPTGPSTADDAGTGALAGMPTTSPPRTFPWWYGFGFVVLGGAIAVAVLWYFSDAGRTLPDWAALVTILLVLVLAIVAGATGGWALGRDRGIEDGRRWERARAVSAAQPPVIPPLDDGARAANERPFGAREAVMVGLGVAAVWFLLLLVAESRRGRPLVESHWGGFGGGVSGWRVSPAVFYLLLAVTFTGLLTALTLDQQSGPVNGDSATAKRDSTRTR